MTVEGIDLIDPVPFHKDEGKSIIHADLVIFGAVNTFMVYFGCHRFCGDRWL